MSSSSNTTSQVNHPDRDRGYDRDAENARTRDAFLAQLGIPREDLAQARERLRSEPSLLSLAEVRESHHRESVERSRTRARSIQHIRERTEARLLSAPSAMSGTSGMSSPVSSPTREPTEFWPSVPRDRIHKAIAEPSLSATKTHAADVTRTETVDLPSQSPAITSEIRYSQHYQQRSAKQPNSELAGTLKTHITVGTVQKTRAVQDQVNVQAARDSIHSHSSNQKTDFGVTVGSSAVSSNTKELATPSLLNSSQVTTGEAGLLQSVKIVDRTKSDDEQGEKQEIGRNRLVSSSVDSSEGTIHPSLKNLDSGVTVKEGIEDIVGSCTSIIDECNLLKRQLSRNSLENLKVTEEVRQTLLAEVREAKKSIAFITKTWIQGVVSLDPVATGSSSKGSSYQTAEKYQNAIGEDFCHVAGSSILTPEGEGEGEGEGKGKDSLFKSTNREQEDNLALDEQSSESSDMNDIFDPSEDEMSKAYSAKQPEKMKGKSLEDATGWEPHSYTSWATNLKWQYQDDVRDILADPTLQQKLLALSKHTTLYPKPLTQFPLADEKNVREQFGFQKVYPFIVKGKSKHPNYPDKDFDKDEVAKNDRFFVRLHAEPMMTDLRAVPQHPDSLPISKLCEYQAVESLGYHVWRHDRETFKCALKSCKGDCPDHRATTQICVGCGPKAIIRYCSRDHLLLDMQRHYKVCGKEPLLIKSYVDEGTQPGRFYRRYPAITDKNGARSYAKHRQRTIMFYTCGRYMLFDDETSTTGLVIDCRDSARIERLLNVALMDQSNKQVLHYLFRMLRMAIYDMTRVTSEDPDMVERLVEQFKAEFNYDANKESGIAGKPCLCVWSGPPGPLKNRSGRTLNKPGRCPRPNCEAPRMRRYGMRPLEQVMRELEAEEWLLRVWHRQHWQVRNWRKRLIGVGFHGVVPSDFKDMRPIMGKGWQGMGATRGPVGGWEKDF